jgi:hypothetical protein
MHLMLPKTGAGRFAAGMAYPWFILGIALVHGPEWP